MIALNLEQQLRWAVLESSKKGFEGYQSANDAQMFLQPASVNTSGAMISLPVFMHNRAVIPITLLCQVWWNI